MPSRTPKEDRGSGWFGFSIAAQFALSMSIALAIVASGAGYLLFGGARRILGEAQEGALVDAVRLSAGPVVRAGELQVLSREREIFEAVEEQVAKSLAEARDEEAQKSLRKLQQVIQTAREKSTRTYDSLAEQEVWRTIPGDTATFADGRVTRSRIAYGEKDTPGVVYTFNRLDGQPAFHLLMPDTLEQSKRSLLVLFVGAIVAIIVAGAVVSVWIGSRVSRPLQQMVEDVRQIATGNLRHRTRAKGMGEVDLLALSIDRMAGSLAEARETEVELQVREREVEVAGEVRKQLLPQSTPTVEGHAIGALHLGSLELGGDFHDFIEIGPSARDGVGLLVCEVSGKGLPGALVGATARSYLRAHLSAGGDVKLAMQETNRQLARDVPRGMAVSAIYALVDAAQGIAMVACTGHKMPLIRWTAADKKVRLIHPEGIALGFDKGPVFDKKLEVAKVPIEPGDRLVLANSGAAALVDAGGAELGEKALYAHIQRLGGLATPQFLQKLRAALEAHAGDTPPLRDVSIITISRS